jgi:hypothetical protein
MVDRNVMRPTGFEPVTGADPAGIRRTEEPATTPSMIRVPIAPPSGRVHNPEPWWRSELAVFDIVGRLLRGRGLTR